jgi:hypothetical protein
MDVLELGHVVADDEEVIALVVYHCEVAHGVTRRRMAHVEAHLERRTGLDD